MNVSNSSRLTNNCDITSSYNSTTGQYDTVYSMCSKKLTGSQLSLPYRINKKLNCETKNKTMSVIGLVQSHYDEGSPVSKRSVKEGRIC